MHLDTPKNKATVMSVRMPFYKKVYEALSEAIDTNTSLRGVLLRQLRPQRPCSSAPETAAIQQ